MSGKASGEQKTRTKDWMKAKSKRQIGRDLLIALSLYSLGLERGRNGALEHRYRGAELRFCGFLLSEASANAGDQAEGRNDRRGLAWEAGWIAG